MSVDRDRSAVPLASARAGWMGRNGGWLLAALIAAYLAAFALHPNLFFALGVAHYDGWFIDTFALLASNDAVTRGRVLPGKFEAQSAIGAGDENGCHDLLPHGANQGARRRINFDPVVPGRL